MTECSETRPAAAAAPSVASSTTAVVVPPARSIEMVGKENHDNGDSPFAPPPPRVSEGGNAGGNGRDNERGAEGSSASGEGATPSSNGGGGNRRRDNDKASKWKWQQNQKKKRKFAADDNDGLETNAKDRRKQKNMRRMKEWDDKDRKQTPHEGSFAHPDMRKLFGVRIEGIDPPLPSGVGAEEGAVEGEGAGAGETAGTAGASTPAAADAPPAAPAVPTDPGMKELFATIDGSGRAPKRKLALLVSFLGHEHVGFQINGAKRTIHATLELAMFRAGLISTQNFGIPQKYGWSNAARTDRGVHAAAQVCSMKAEVVGGDDSPAGLDTLRERVNAVLADPSFAPERVRVLDVRKTTRKFCARTSRDKVRYQYMVPSFLLAPKEFVLEAFAAVEADVNSNGGQEQMMQGKMNPNKSSKLTEAALLGIGRGHNRGGKDGDDDAKSDPSPALLRAREALLGYRADPATLARFRSALKLFEGTHCFHNYTRRVDGTEDRAARYILSFGASDPVTFAGEGGGLATEWIPALITGQSFMFNQIRKMISAATDVGRGAASEEELKRSLEKKSKSKINVAPAQGLFLERSYFEAYNRHLEGDKMRKETNGKDGGLKSEENGDRESAPVQMLDWMEDGSPAVRRLEDFKDQTIIPHILREEAEEGNFLRYIYAQDHLWADVLYKPYNTIGEGGGDDPLGDEDGVGAESD